MRPLFDRIPSAEITPESAYLDRRAFLRAALPAQSVAFSTQSSLASLPAMLQASHTLGLPERQVGTVLPLAVALFRALGGGWR